jgi:hypothetical protein
MKRVLAMTLLMAAAGASTSALAETFDFTCVAGAGYTCYFSMIDDAQHGNRSWTMRPQETNRINDLSFGDKYFVASAPVYGDPQLCAVVRSKGGWCYFKTINRGVNN